MSHDYELNENELEKVSGGAWEPIGGICGENSGGIIDYSSSGDINNTCNDGDISAAPSDIVDIGGIVGRNG